MSFEQYRVHGFMVEDHVGVTPGVWCPKCFMGLMDANKQDVGWTRQLQKMNTLKSPPRHTICSYRWCQLIYVDGEWRPQTNVDRMQQSIAVAETVKW